MIELFHFVLPAGTVHLHRTSGKDTPYFRYFSSPQGSTSVTMLQIISKVSDATWLNLVKSAGSSVLCMDWFICCWSMFQDETFQVKLEKSSLLHRCQKNAVNICEHCGIVHSFGLSFIWNTQKTAILDLPRSSDSRWIIVRRSWLNSFSVLRDCPSRWYFDTWKF